MRGKTRWPPIGVTLSLAASAFFFWVWYERYLSIEFNELGRYFDADAGIVYTEAAFVWILPALGFLLLAVIQMAWRWASRPPQDPEAPAMTPERKTKGDLGLYALVEGAISLGLLAGVPLAAALGQLMLAGILLVVALGLFLRFKRTTAWKRKRKP